jgi:predicted DNA binding CopG/RHH family protein
MARVEKPVQRVNVDFPRALLEAIDAEAARLGIARQAYIKLRVADSLKERKP